MLSVIVAVTTLGGVVAALAPRGTALHSVADVAAAPSTAAPDHVVRRAAPAFPQDAWVAVTVATIWAHPTSPRRTDAPALHRPVDLAGWIASMSVSQERDLTDRVYTQALLGDKVVVLGAADSWRKVRVVGQTGGYFKDGIIGWLPASQLSTAPPPTTERTVAVAARTAWLHVRNPDGAVGRQTLQVSYGTILPLVGAHDGWLRVAVPDGGTQLLAQRDARLLPKAPPTGAQIAAEAKRFLHLQYLWAGTSAYGFDCSGFTYALYRQFGVRIMRDAADQAHHRPVGRAELQPGDLLLFGTGDWTHIHHVGVYVGNGMMVDAPHAGVGIEMVPLWHSRWTKEFWGARRVLD